jgi:class 3 adenylate cyclase
MGAVPAASLHHQQTTVGFAPATDRRRAVLLGSELRGLARMSDVLEPGLVILLANEYFGWAGDIVATFGGEAITSQHELLLSMFTRGLPVHNAQQAVRAAQRIQSGFPELAERWRKTYGLRTAVAQGLHMGEAVIGLAGPRGQERRVAFGDSVSLAQSIVHRARAGEFVMTDSVMGALSVENLDLDAEPLPPLDLPRRTPIRIYGVLVEARLDFTAK